MACTCCYEPTEEELLEQLAGRRQRWDEDWQQRSPEEQERTAQRYAKSIAYNDQLIQQVQQRLAKRLETEAEPPAV